MLFIQWWKERCSAMLEVAPFTMKKMEKETEILDDAMSSRYEKIHGQESLYLSDNSTLWAYGRIKDDGRVQRLLGVALNLTSSRAVLLDFNKTGQLPRDFTPHGAAALIRAANGELRFPVWDECQLHGGIGG
ncbi:hypothetical protein BDR22DRAFT_818035 [Usnea florida]